MHKLIKPIFWTFLFLIMMLAIDQFFVQVPPVHPAHAAVSAFYRDFRGRLIDLVSGEKNAAPKSIEAVIDKQQDKKTTPKKMTETKPVTSKAPAEPDNKKTQRYIYSDSKGELHFADSLEEVPEEYRALAQPMGN